MTSCQFTFCIIFVDLQNCLEVNSWEREWSFFLLLCLWVATGSNNQYKLLNKSSNTTSLPLRGDPQQPPAHKHRLFFSFQFLQNVVKRNNVLKIYKYVVHLFPDNESLRNLCSRVRAILRGKRRDQGGGRIAWNKIWSLRRGRGWDGVGRVGTKRKKKKKTWKCAKCVRGNNKGETEAEGSPAIHFCAKGGRCESGLSKWWCLNGIK